MLGAQEGLDETHADIDRLARHCRYPDCRHGAEPGCAVRAALERDELSEEHLQNCLKLQKESDFHDLSALNRRRSPSAPAPPSHAPRRRDPAAVR
jgi:ribosome biogenesis GTPase / thiamine phosphate phosphatase